MTQHWITRAVSYLPHPDVCDKLVVAGCVLVALWAIGSWLA